MTSKLTFLPLLSFSSFLCLFSLPFFPHPSSFSSYSLIFVPSLLFLIFSSILSPMNPPPPPPGPTAVLLPGRSGVDFPGSVGGGSGRPESHVVCRGTGLVRTGPGGTAQSPVCHQASGLEGRAAQVRAEAPSALKGSPVLGVEQGFCWLFIIQ